MKTKICMLIIVLIGATSMLFTSCNKNDEDDNDLNTVKDIDGNVYHTVTIGTQIWMVENLITTRYRNGETIPNVIETTIWVNLTSGACCNYNNNADNLITYGRLYNWYAVNDSRNIAPTGWHVPTVADWTILTTYLGADSIAGGKLKETGTEHWNNPNTSATNETGFTALPGGYRNYYGIFDDIRNYGYFWSSSEATTYHANCRSMCYNSNALSKGFIGKPIALSVRCVKD